MHSRKLLPLALASVLVTQSAIAQQASKPGLAQRLQELLSAPAEDELLEPERAFGVTVRVASPSLLVAELAPAPGYYLYRDRIRFALKDAPGVVIESVTLPKGKVKKDPTFGATEIYAAPVRAEIALLRPPGARKITLLAAYQGCHEKTGVCYPPQEKALAIALP